LNTAYSTLLKDFFPRYITVLKPYKEDLREIRIEGHTDNDFDYGPGIREYFFNMELSQGRTRSTLIHCLQMIYNDKEVYNWVKPLVTANGLSSSKLITVDGIIDKAASRRVEFRIRTNAEEKLDIIYAKYLEND
jgi:outer membrane protein OmpA-like peptidoglycan-associated protein